MSTGTGKRRPPGTILLLGGGDNQLAGSHLASGTAGEGVESGSGGASRGESPGAHASLVGSEPLRGGGVREQRPTAQQGFIV